MIIVTTLVDKWLQKIIEIYLLIVLAYKVADLVRCGYWRLKITSQGEFLTPTPLLFNCQELILTLTYSSVTNICSVCCTDHTN